MPPPQSYQQVGADLTDNVANFAQSTFSTFSNFLQKPEKLASGKDTINEVGGFQLEFVSISRVINHMTYYNSSALNGVKFILKNPLQDLLSSLNALISTNEST
jgi:hypothetical protein